MRTIRKYVLKLSDAKKMKSEVRIQPVASEKIDAAFLAPCVVAALIWLALSLYMLVIVPLNLDIHSQSGKPEQLRAALPAGLRMAARFYEGRGTAWVALLGVLGCGVAHARRSVVLANGMILVGAIFLSVLIWVVFTS